jgi:chemotaxis protein methyltransferase CheR
MGSADTPPRRPQLSEREFTELAELVRDATGIAVEPSRRAWLSARLSELVALAGCSSFHEYCERVKRDASGAELRVLTSAVTTHRTEFFREPRQFERLRFHLAPELERRTSRPRVVRAWSAACATGEEPYTLAMTLLEHFAPGSGWSVEVLATDIDERVLAHAERGIYDEAQLACVPDELREKWFVAGRGRWRGHAKVRRELAARVRFRRLNLAASSWGLRTRFDLVFCRNVAIYFDPATESALFRRLRARLADGGHLFVGQAEGSQTLAELFEDRGDCIYRRSRSPAAALPRRDARRAPRRTAEPTQAPTGVAPCPSSPTGLPPSAA